MTHTGIMCFDSEYHAETWQHWMTQHPETTIFDYNAGDLNEQEEN